MRPKAPHGELRPEMTYPYMLSFITSAQIAPPMGHGGMGVPCIRGHSLAKATEIPCVYFQFQYESLG